VPIIFAFHKRDKARAEAAEAAEEAARAADGPNPAAALGTTPLLPPMGPITPGASSFYRRRRLPSSPSGHLHAHHAGGSHSSSVAGGGGSVPGTSGNTSLASELAAATSDRSLAGWILRFGRGRRGGGASGRLPAAQRRDSSDDSLV